jgi:hypothetical protein
MTFTVAIMRLAAFVTLVLGGVAVVGSIFFNRYTQ